MRQQVVPMIQGQAGNQGIAMAVDRQGGRGSVVSFWADLDALRGSDPLAKRLQDEVRERYGATFDTTPAEVVEMRVTEQPKPGCWNRISVLDVGADGVDAAVEALRARALPAVEGLDGLCAVLVCADRERGRVIGVTTWRHRDALQGSASHAHEQREPVRQMVGAPTLEVTEQEVVIAAGSAVEPDQR
ncbi:MAG: hypothetical protein ACJ74O_19595 [Frankiaceae bacterium]